ncbi:hypothetical protein BN59_03061 [Legionella massiliensis]|uniref:Dot/Icm T4SS effector n=1 Tax=Legionella massiliensis TaxID=1034943 RepID=A0A078L477_9GAMM|nr:hypothetical protein [Legionella massiliensis]CDZ78748.1 hypothetical protein BN59_03061 [Legionella massiliensis]CEE14486.1 hypothetical protein BN1094_03061 [Legionella massiliensis]
MTIHVYSFDFDGCIYNAKYSNSKNVITSNQELLDAIKLEIEQSNAHDAIVFVGSNRQSYDLDQYNASKNDTGSCFKDIPLIAKHLGATLDTLLLADIYCMQADGTAFTKACDPNVTKAGHSDSWFDTSKFLLLYAQMHKVANQYSNEKIVFDFYDDIDDILGDLQKFFAKNPSYIPANLTLRLHKYTGNGLEHQIKFRGLEAVHVVELTPIQGKGEVNAKYRNKILDLAGKANHEESINCIDRIRHPEKYTKANIPVQIPAYTIPPAPSLQPTVSSMQIKMPKYLGTALSAFEEKKKNAEIIQSAKTLDITLKTKATPPEEDFAEHAYNELNKHLQAADTTRTNRNVHESLKRKRDHALRHFKIDGETGTYKRDIPNKTLNLPVIPEIHQIPIPEITTSQTEWKKSYKLQQRIHVGGPVPIAEHTINYNFIPEMCGSFADPDFYLDLIEKHIESCRKVVWESYFKDKDPLNNKLRLKECYFHINEYIATVAASIANISKEISKEFEQSARNNIDNTQVDADYYMKTSEEHGLNLLECASEAKTRANNSVREHETMSTSLMVGYKDEYEYQKMNLDYAPVILMAAERFDHMTKITGCNERKILKTQMAADICVKARNNYFAAYQCFKSENANATAVQGIVSQNITSFFATPKTPCAEVNVINEYAEAPQKSITS